MKYFYQVSDINNYDIDMLAQEIRSAGMALQAIHSGNGVLIFEFVSAITDAEKAAIQPIISKHQPIWFEWTENSENKKRKVHCAEDIDRITAMRIRGAIGGQDPIQEQLKALRLALFVHDVALNPADYTQADVDIAAQIRTQLRSVNASIEVIRQQGKQFKKARRWT